MLSPTDPTGILFPADSVGILFPVVPAGIPFPLGPDHDGTLSPADPAGILCPADLAELVTLDGAGSADAGILFPAVVAEFPISMDPAGVLLPTDLAEFDTVGVVDMAVVGEVLPAVPDVFDSPDLVAMVGVDTVKTVEEIPMVYDDDCDIRDPRNDFETVDGMPVYYGGDFNDSAVKTLVILLMRIGWTGITLTLRMDVLGVSRMIGRPGCLVLHVPL